MNIIEAIHDKHLFRPFLGNDLESWRHWLTALRVMYGLPLIGPKCEQLIRQCTKRDPAKLPPAGFSVTLFLTGRRSGKSRIAAVIAAFEAVLAGHEHKLAKGEKGMVAIVSPTRDQSRIVYNYLKAVFDASPLLQSQVANITTTGVELLNGVRIEILAGDWRTIRGYTLLAVVIDEICFFGLDDGSKTRSDTELIRALLPGLATINGKLVAISSPYAKRGWTYSQYQKSMGNDGASTLVWNAPSRVMNPTLPESLVNKALQDDYHAARSEYMGEFRDDVSIFLPRDLIEMLVVKDRSELLPTEGRQYYGFADLSGGRGDDAVLAIAHKQKRTVVIDVIRRFKPPFNPHQVIGDMARELKRWGLRRVTGDNYSAEFCAGSFQGNGILYIRCENPKSELYLELLPRLCSKEIELLDYPILVEQLASLERRVRAGGRDIIDHPAGGKDDVANAVAGVAITASKPILVCGAF